MSAPRLPEWAEAVPPWVRAMVVGGVAVVVVAAIGSAIFRAVRRYLEVDPVQVVSTDRTWTSRDGVVTLTTPPSFVDETGRAREEAEAQLVVSDEANDSRILVFDIEKRSIGRVVTLSQVALAWRTGTHAMTDVRLGRQTDTRIAAHAATEMTFDAKDTRGVPIQGHAVLVDGDGYYHLILAGSARDVYPRREAMLRSIVATVRFHLP